MGLVIGVDGGGTKTIAVIVDAQGQVVSRGQAGASNSRSDGAEAASGALAAAIKDALQRGSVSLDQVEAMCLCVAGFDTEIDQPVPTMAMRLLGYAGPSIFENDVVGAWAGAFEGGPGVVAVSGTGSTSMGMNSRGDFWRAGGWDYVLGDEGSGYAIGLAGIRAGIRALDGRGDPAGAHAPLALALRDAYGTVDIEGLRLYWDSGRLGKREIAAFAEHVIRAARQQYAPAREILVGAAHALVESAGAVIRQLDMAEGALPVCTVGGVFNSEIIAEVFRSGLAKIAPQASIAPPMQPPEIGAALLARQRLQQRDFASWTLGTGARHIKRSMRVTDLHPSEATEQ